MKTNLNKLLVAVSGGPDSMAALAIVLSYGKDIEVAHVNYNKRDTANRDQKIVEKYCSENGIKLHTLQVTEEVNGNFQAEARKIRYDWMVELCKQNNLEAIVVAHHKDDLLETFIMQKERKGFVTYYGLNEESKYEDVLIIRPLLKKTKDDLIKYCNDNNIEFGIDESNFEDTYKRNRVRKELLNLTNEDKQKLLNEIVELNKTNNTMINRINELYFKYVVGNSISREVFNEDKSLLTNILFKFLIDNGYSYELLSSKTVEEIINFNNKVSQGNATIDLKQNWKMKNCNKKFNLINEN